MITQTYRSMNCTGSNTFFIIQKSEDQLYDEMIHFIKEYGTNDNKIYAYEQPVKPSKENLRPEYSMELKIMNKDDSSIILWFRKVHG